MWFPDSWKLGAAWRGPESLPRCGLVLVLLVGVGGTQLPRGVTWHGYGTAVGDRRRASCPFVSGLRSGVFCVFDGAARRQAVCVRPEGSGPCMETAVPFAGEFQLVEAPQAAYRRRKQEVSSTWGGSGGTIRRRRRRLVFVPKSMLEIGRWHHTIYLSVFFNLFCSFRWHRCTTAFPTLAHQAGCC